jgi:thiamine-phosphate pyrophosphorylase
MHRFYPILPDSAWLARLAPLGLKVVQLRVKDAAKAVVRREIAESLKICADHGCQLIVNDYWREAIELGADYIHLGQEDLAAADLPAIRNAGLRLGLSTHSVEELSCALAAAPDYVALGPVYETTLKVMKWAPQGLARVGEWRQRLRATSPVVPLVAIGGVTLERAAEVFAAGAESIAVVTDVVKSPDPEARVRAWLAAAAPGADGGYK